MTVMTIQAVERLLQAHGYCVMPRDYGRKPQHEGKFMLVDDEEEPDDEDAYCIVGDDRAALVREAYEHIFG